MQGPQEQRDSGPCGAVMAWEPLEQPRLLPALLLLLPCCRSSRLSRPLPHHCYLYRRGQFPPEISQRCSPRNHSLARALWRVEFKDRARGPALRSAGLAGAASKQGDPCGMRLAGQGACLRSQ